MKKIFFILICFILHSIYCFSNEYSKLYGKWIIESEIPSEQIHERDACECLGKEIVYEKNSVEYDGHIFTVTNVTEEELTSDLLFSYTVGIGENSSKGVTFRKLGIQQEKVSSITLKMKERIPRMWIIIIDENTIIINYKGLFFRTLRE